MKQTKSPKPHLKDDRKVISEITPQQSGSIFTAQLPNSSTALCIFPSLIWPYLI